MKTKNYCNIRCLTLNKRKNGNCFKLFKGIVPLSVASKPELFDLFFTSINIMKKKLFIPYQVIVSQSNFHGHKTLEVKKSELPCNIRTELKIIWTQNI